MTASRRPRRALLFCPATDRRKIEKAAGLDADSVILDLEDAVALSRKAEARVEAARALEEVDFGRSERLVRVNPAGGGLEVEDIRVTAGGLRPPDGYVIPKVELASDLKLVTRLLAEIESERRLPEGTFRIFCIVETARGIVRLREIAEADPRIEALVFGAEDLCGDMGATRTRSGHEIAYARSALVLHCAAERLQAIDTPFIAVNDEAGLVSETRDALEMGFTGKLAIHPKQVAPITAAFTPTPAEIRAAQRLVREHERHQALGSGVFLLDGKMIDMPMVRAAERVLERARAAGVPGER